MTGTGRVHRLAPAKAAGTVEESRRREVESREVESRKVESHEVEKGPCAIPELRGLLTFARLAAIRSAVAWPSLPGVP